MRKNEQLIGAAAERKAILRKLRKMQQDFKEYRGYFSAHLQSMIEWLLKRCERYDRAQGGLGRKRKGV